MFERWGLRPQTPVPRAAEGFAPKPPASGGWGLCPQTPNTAPPLRISGYAPASQHVFLCFSLFESGIILRILSYFQLPDEGAE